MNDKEERELRNYCAWLLKEYGFNFPPTDPVLPALYVIHRQMMAARKSNETLAEQFKDATKSLAPVVYNFSQPGEGWKFQAAASIRWAVGGLSLVAISWIAFVWWQARNDHANAKLIIDSASVIESTLMQSAKRDSDGYLYLEFTEATGNKIKNFTEYDEIAHGKVRVYLGKSKSTD